ncbi:hypothetical protein [Allokutzneria oryzae]|uniref:Tat pathway signal sequence domain protein n=1 Tax=Allokutzneria oryzae TaxID=1378989 RepID=A0ABV6A032_9PSEU
MEHLSTSRRSLLLGATATAGLLALPGPATAAPAWQLRWSPDPNRDAPAAAFAGLEQHAHTQHIHARDGAYRFDMHCPPDFADVDVKHGDRQRTEARGMRSGGEIKILQDQTWRISYDMFVPNTLRPTTAFTHIFQIKVRDIAPPLVTLTLNARGGGVIEMRTSNDSGAYTTHDGTSYESIRNRWTSVDIEVKASNSGAHVAWTLRDTAGQTLLNRRITGLDMWRGQNWLTPKWGVYRSLSSSGRVTTYLLTRNMKAHQLG